ncbi:MAG: histidine--tRNA ligase [Candidatus Pacearchaeota archaeon]
MEKEFVQNKISEKLVEMSRNINFRCPRGTRDILPEEMKLREIVYSKLRRVIESYGFSAVETPAFENFDVLAAKGGPEIEEQIYTFTDKGGRKLGLRFDLTVPIARLVATNPKITKPAKLYYISNMWRYEKPQTEQRRLREFYQCGVELIGSPLPIADAEVISLGIDCLIAVGLDPSQIRVFINDRLILDGFIESLGIKENRIMDTIRIIDKKEKIKEDAFVEELEKIGIDSQKIEQIIEFTNIRGDPEAVLKISYEKLPKNEKIKKGLENLKSILEYLKILEKLNYCIYDLGIARGLDYYTSTIFEAYEVDESMKKVGGSILGGGRYDNLIEMFGGKSTPATGWGLGIERLLNLLNKKGLAKIPEVEKNPVFVAPVNDSMRAEAIKIVNILRRSGLKAETDLLNKSLKKQFELINRKGNRITIIVGLDELSNGKVKCRDMKSGNEELIPLDELPDRIKSKFSEFDREK